MQERKEVVVLILPIMIFIISFESAIIRSQQSSRDEDKNVTVSRWLASYTDVHMRAALVWCASNGNGCSNCKHPFIRVYGSIRSSLSASKLFTFSVLLPKTS